MYRKNHIETQHFSFSGVSGKTEGNLQDILFKGKIESTGLFKVELKNQESPTPP
jgi:hypothetical protein